MPGTPRIPGVDDTLKAPFAAPLIRLHGRARVKQAVRSVLADMREGGVDPDAIGEAVRSRLPAHGYLTPVFNLTGTLIHTNLGRAPLPESAVQAVVASARQPVTLEYDLEHGRRGKRDLAVAERLQALTGAEAVCLVNNNAAAVLLVLNTLALNREVPVSRGELIEIGGSFRIPDIMSRAGCRLIEVGTTNRTHEEDYARAINPDTALLMKVHPSNYRVSGFTREVSASALGRIAHQHSLPAVFDLGSGALVDLGAYNLQAEPTVGHVLRDGVDLVTFSGDKLLGGPQAGIIAGRRDLIDPCNSNPLKRALRLDRMALAALDAVLKLYEDPQTLSRDIPLYRFLSRTPAQLHKLAQRVCVELVRLLPRMEVSITEQPAEVGSGAMPLSPVTGCCVTISAASRPLRAVEAWFRGQPKPILGRMAGGCLHLELRAVDEPEELIACLRGMQPLSYDQQNA